MSYHRETHGYTPSELERLAVDGRLDAQVSKWDLDTPTLCLDLDRFEANMRTMQTALSRTGLGLRPHAKTHKCPAIAHRQMNAGAIGICTATIGEAEIMIANGIDRVLMTSANVTPGKIRRSMQLRARSSEFIQAVDSPENAERLSEAADAAKVEADVVVDVDPGNHRTGTAPGEPALALAQLVDRLPGLRLRGLLCYDGPTQHVEGFEARRREALSRLEPAVETYGAMNRAGLSTEIFSGGGTGTYDIHHETPGFTDLQAGSYIFMDTQYMSIGGADGRATLDAFLPALTVLTTVVNAQFEGVATGDAGTKALTLNRPWPQVVGETGLTYRPRSDEFGLIEYANPSLRRELGDKLELIVSHCDPTVNLYDVLVGTRGDRVESIWRIAARGPSR